MSRDNRGAARSFITSMQRTTMREPRSFSQMALCLCVEDGTLQSADFWIFCTCAVCCSSLWGAPLCRGYVQGLAPVLLLDADSVRCAAAAQPQFFQFSMPWKFSNFVLVGSSKKSFSSYILQALECSHCFILRWRSERTLNCRVASSQGHTLRFCMEEC